MCLNTLCACAFKFCLHGCITVFVSVSEFMCMCVNISVFSFTCAFTDMHVHYIKKNRDKQVIKHIHFIHIRRNEGKEAAA